MSTVVGTLELKVGRGRRARNQAGVCSAESDENLQVTMTLTLLCMREMSSRKGQAQGKVASGRREGRERQEICDI
jgi:hypothetical protein